MAKITLFSRLGSVMIALMLFSSCARVENKVLTLTFTSQGCSCEAPKTLDPAFNVEWVIDDSKNQDYVYIMATLADGKTREDLASWLETSTEHPVWANILTYNVSNVGGQTISKAHDLSSNAMFDGSPVYIICAIGDQLFIEGPIRIKE